MAARKELVELRRLTALIAAVEVLLCGLHPVLYLANRRERQLFRSVEDALGQYHADIHARWLVANLRARKTARNK